MYVNVLLIERLIIYIASKSGCYGVKHNYDKWQ